MSTTAGVGGGVAWSPVVVWEGVVVQRWDVFVSYAHEDEAWVGVLAENLHRADVDVFFDRWEVIGEVSFAA